jgi:CRISPR system Cascade subunit CasC
MSKFGKLEFHLLVTTSLHNMNRGEDGRPKTAMVNQTQRGRFSSQAKKRAMRYHADFPNGERAKRTREAGLKVFDRLHQAGAGTLGQRVMAAMAVDYALGGGGKEPTLEAAEELIAPKNEKAKKAREDKVRKRMQEWSEDEATASIEVLRHSIGPGQGLVVSTREFAAIDRLADSVMAAWEKRVDAAEQPAKGGGSRKAKAGPGAADPFTAELNRLLADTCKKGLLSDEELDIDIAILGRMVAARPTHNVEAAAQVSHAFTTHVFSVEGDFFSAGEELNVLKGTGAAITSYAFFGMGTYYLNAILDLDLLYENCGKDLERTKKALAAFWRTLMYAMPRGKENGFSGACPPVYALCLHTKEHAWSQGMAFGKPVRAGHNEDMVVESVRRLRNFFTKSARSLRRKGVWMEFVGYPALQDGKAPATPAAETWDIDAFGAFVEAALERDEGSLQADVAPFQAPDAAVA